MLTLGVCFALLSAVSAENENITLGAKDLVRLYRTAHTLGVSESILSKISEKLTSEKSDFAYGDSDGTVRIDAVDESPDYASSVVLASDLLSLSSAVANVKAEACKEQGYRFLDGLIKNQRWALKMFDASAKSPQGLLFGSSYHLGNFDECVGVDVVDNGTTSRGQYCLATIKWRHGDEVKKVRTGRGETLRWAVCVPSACDAQSVEGFVSDVLALSVGNKTRVVVSERDCYTRRPIDINRLDIAFLSLIMFFGMILLFTTVYEIYSIKWGQNKGTAHEILISFSIINNVKKIISTKQNNTLGLECIAGIKAIAMIFILAGHACTFIASGPVMDSEAWDRLIRNPANSFMLSNTLLVDSFLFLSAFLFSRLLLIELDKRRGRLNVLPILIVRYIRVTPAYFVVILFYMTWLPKIGVGPLWEDRMRLEQERCLASWWANILYVNNYVNTDYLCMFQSWYLAVDTQLFFLAPIFIYSLWHWRRFGLVLTACMTLVSLAIPSIITYRGRLDPTLLIYAKELTDFATNPYFRDVYMKTHNKITSYIMGILTGFILHKIQKQNYEFSKLLKVFGWTTSVILGTITTFSISVFYQDWYKYNAIEAAAYVSLHGFSWSITNAWLIIACATGNGGILGRLLTYKIFVPIARLTFCAYLVNGIVELYYLGQLRHPVHITFFTVLANGTSHVLLTFLLGMILCVMFESPLHGIEKTILRLISRPVLSDNAIKNGSSDVISRNTSQSKLDS
ncbi:nose resistant to fluoxetine protein 6-like [Aricia agestis]|uniref:nose resistant to fluoxetine protein 6-like n=1 Tax=Aricia agestis TaxID=91739 RepID=UPI001C2096DF|nr:nose resistant to fluoxetine protein 6-like [Aricia agestis]